MFWMTETRFVLPQTLVGGGGAHSYSPEAGFELSVVESGGQPFSELILSWNADTPPGTSIYPEARLRYTEADAPPEASAWSAWASLGRWGSGSHGEQRLPHSHGGEAGAPVRLEVDTLRLDTGLVADAFQVRLTLSGWSDTPVVRRLTASTRLVGASPPDALADQPLGRAVRLAVPDRSQRAECHEIAGEICSPASIGMVLDYYGIARTTAEIAEAVFDHGAQIYGNWPFNVAYAGSLGLRGVVRHIGSMAEIERELGAGHPPILSIAFGPGELPEAPIPSTDGHLIVVTGVTQSGDFLVNDPAADTRRGEAIERVYSRDHLRAAFLGHGGVAYIIEKEPDASAAPLPADAPSTK
ncbi:MAG: C39 family peptidase [Chloroflexia bacterium]